MEGTNRNMFDGIDIFWVWLGDLFEISTWLFLFSLFSLCTFMIAYTFNDFSNNLNSREVMSGKNPFSRQNKT